MGLVLGGAFVGVSASLTTADYAVAQVASSIVVQGNRRVETDTIRSYFILKPGEKLDPAKVDEGIKSLMATGLFSDVQPTWRGGQLIITPLLPGKTAIGAINGNREVMRKRTPAGPFTMDLVEYPMPTIVTAPNYAAFNGSSSTPLSGALSPMTPAGATGTASCQWSLQPANGRFP